MFLLMFSSPLIDDLHRLFAVNLGLSLGCSQLIRVRSDRNIVEEITTNITVVAMLVTTSALAENSYPKPTTDGRDRIQHTGTCPTGYVGNEHINNRRNNANRNWGLSE
jgi:hypothetical protein